jgi:hypothetical protein
MHMTDASGVPEPIGFEGFVKLIVQAEKFRVECDSESGLVFECALDVCERRSMLARDRLDSDVEAVRRSAVCSDDGRSKPAIEVGIGLRQIP